MKRSVILTDRLGPDILLVFRVKGLVLHRGRANLKTPGCSLVLSALLTKKLPTFSAGNNSRSSDTVRPNFENSGQFHIMIGHDDRTCHQHILSSLLQGVVSQ